MMMMDEGEQKGGKCGGIKDDVERLSHLGNVKGGFDLPCLCQQVEATHTGLAHTYTSPPLHGPTSRKNNIALASGKVRTARVRDGIRMSAVAAPTGRGSHSRDCSSGWQDVDIRNLFDCH